MKQKYIISRSHERNELTIKEYAELDKEILSLICEVTYADKDIETAFAKGKETLISKLRTNNLYPPALFIDDIAESVIVMYGSEKKQPVELVFDDIELIAKDKEKPVTADDVNEDDIKEELDEDSDLLEDSFSESYEDKHEFKNINSPIKVAEDEITDANTDAIDDK